MTDGGRAAAAVDVGTNSVRLLVVDAAGRRITRQLAITRLGEGVDRTGALDAAALRRTLDTIERFADIWRSHGVQDRVRIAATSAIRDASNRAAFFDGVRAVAGVDAEVLSGEQEAALAYAGAVGAVATAAPTAVIDIGGGSTELIIGGVERGVPASVSLQLGCVRLAERHLHGDPPEQDELVAARAEVRARLDEADEELAQSGISLWDAAELVGVAGTVTTIGALHLGLDAYDETRIHGTRVPADRLGELTVALTRMTVAERAELGPVQPGREDVLHGGAIILTEAVDRYGFAEVVVSETDSLDGLAAALV